MHTTCQPNAIIIQNKAGDKLAEVTFPEIEPGVVDINHTFVSNSLRGQGIAGLLMQKAAAQPRQTDRKAKLSCSYAQKWFAQHPEFADVVK